MTLVMHTSSLDAVTFVAIDTETTGLSPRYGDRLVELAAVRFTLDAIETQWETLMWPHCPIGYGAQRVHGLSTSQLHDAPCFHEIVGDFLNFVGDAVVVMHNAPFDARFLATHLAETGHIWRPTIFDTLRLLRRNFSLPSNSLGPAIRHFGIARAATHRAAADATATADLFRLIVRQKGAQTLPDLIRLHGKVAGLPTVDLPPCDDLIRFAISQRATVEIDYATNARPLVGQIEGIAQGERQSYCTLRLANGKRLHLIEHRIRSIRLFDGFTA